MKVTHQKIADRLGVSRTLVTSVLHGTGRFGANESTRVRIEQTAREMGYQPRNRTTHTIGYLMPDALMRSSIDMEFVIAAESALRERGYRLMLVNLELPAGQAIEDIINPKTVDGVLLTYWNQKKFEPLLSPHMPFLLLSEEKVSSKIEQVCTGLKGTALAALRYLLDFNHNRIVMFTGKAQKPFYVRLGQAARDAAHEIGEEPEYSHWSPIDFQIVNTIPSQSGPRLVQLLRAPAAPTAVIVTDMEHALSVYCAVLGAGYRIPDDLCILSLFDNREYAMMVPALTATDAGGPKLATKAVKRLVEKIQMPETIPQHTMLAGEIIERDSVKAIARRFQNGHR